MLCLVASSEHALAEAIVKGAEERALKLVATQDFASETGMGVTGTIDGRVAVGNKALFASLALMPDHCPSAPMRCATTARA